jgi:hypothetical protein
LQEIENGFKIYPHGQSWEYEPEWFIYLLNAGQAKLNEVRSDKQWQEKQAKKVK